MTAPPIPDADGDGVHADTDCNDGDASVHPGAEELCDNIDNDCDGATDIGVQRVCCDTGMQECTGGAWTECSETCNDVDGDGDPDPSTITGGCSTGGGGGGAALGALGLIGLVGLVRRRVR